jgi:hypothetical protein
MSGGSVTDLLLPIGTKVLLSAGYPAEYYSPTASDGYTAFLLVSSYPHRPPPN